MSMEIEEEDSGETAPEMEAPGVSTVAIAVSGSRSSRHALKWALDKFVPDGRVLFRILHVRQWAITSRSRKCATTWHRHTGKSWNGKRGTCCSHTRRCVLRDRWKLKLFYLNLMMCLLL